MTDINILNKAIQLAQTNHFDEAVNIYNELLKTAPNDYIVLSSLGLLYVEKKNYEKAREYLLKASQIKETAGIISALGFAEYEQQLYADSAKTFEKALAYGKSADTYNKLICSLFQIGNFAKATVYAREMYKKYPDIESSNINMVRALTHSGKTLEAEKICVDYLKLHNDSVRMWHHLGYLKELMYCDDVQACQCYEMAANFGDKAAFYNIAVSYTKLGQYDKAEKYYKKMLENFPNDVTTKTSFGMCYLVQKKFYEGYQCFSKTNDIVSSYSKTNKIWEKGQDLDDEVIVFCEQGFGDHIQFIRYIPFLAQKVKKINIVARKQLLNLFKENYPDLNYITADKIPSGLQILRVTELAYILDMDFNNIPFNDGYLKSEKAKIYCDKLKVGLCWEAGAVGIRGMINRTVPINFLEPIINMNNIQLYSMQIVDTLDGCKRYPQIINLGKDFKDFTDTAKALMAMDIIITVDTVIAHLAGALGIKTYLLLPRSSDWRWFTDSKITPWYSSVELFRQTDYINWIEPIKEITSKLA